MRDGRSGRRRAHSPRDAQSRQRSPGELAVVAGRAWHRVHESTDVAYEGIASLFGNPSVVQPSQFQDLIQGAAIFATTTAQGVTTLA